MKIFRILNVDDSCDDFDCKYKHTQDCKIFGEKKNCDICDFRSNCSRCIHGDYCIPLSDDSWND